MPLLCIGWQCCVTRGNQGFQRLSETLLLMLLQCGTQYTTRWCELELQDNAEHRKLLILVNAHMEYQFLHIPSKGQHTSFPTNQNVNNVESFKVCMFIQSLLTTFLYLLHFIQ